MRKWKINIHLVTKLPFGVNIKDLIDDLKIFSWEASDVLTYYSRILRETNNKSNIIKSDDDKGPVTIADLKVNEIIIKRINEKYQNVNWTILSEENVKFSPFQSDKKSDWVWVLDPLDGTKDFIQGTGNYAMHLALNHKGKPYIGIVLIPEKDELWIADGEKVWCEKKNGTKFKPNLSQKVGLQNMFLVTSKNHRNEALRKLIQKINFEKVIIMGSIGCKISSIIRGDSDIYICLSMPGKTSPKDWDFAAPEAILKAAGGSITNINNEELSYGKSNYEQSGIIVASNDSVMHKNICFQIKNIIKENDLYPNLI